jgi:hypothetical protein
MYCRMLHVLTSRSVLNSYSNAGRSIKQPKDCILKAAACEDFQWLIMLWSCLVCKHQFIVGRLCVPSVRS